MAERRGRNRTRMYTSSSGEDIYKTGKNKGSPYHKQDKATGRIKSLGMKGVEARLYPSTGGSGGGGTSVPPTPKGGLPASQPSSTPAIKTSSIPATTPPPRTEKFMGNAQRVPPTSLPPSNTSNVGMPKSASGSSLIRKLGVLGVGVGLGAAAKEAYEGLKEYNKPTTRSDSGIDARLERQKQKRNKTEGRVTFTEKQKSLMPKPKTKKTAEKPEKAISKPKTTTSKKSSGTSYLSTTGKKEFMAASNPYRQAKPAPVVDKSSRALKTNNVKTRSDFHDPDLDSMDMYGGHSLDSRKIK